MSRNRDDSSGINPNDFEFDNNNNNNSQEYKQGGVNNSNSMNRYSQYRNNDTLDNVGNNGGSSNSNNNQYGDQNYHDRSVSNHSTTFDDAALWAELNAASGNLNNNNSNNVSPPISPKNIILPSIKKPSHTSGGSSSSGITPTTKLAAPTPSILSSPTSTGIKLYISDKTRSLHQVIEEIDKKFGDCNDKIKKHINQINILYIPTHQKILSNFFSSEERDNIYSLVRPTYVEMYQQLYKLLWEVHHQRGNLLTTMHQNNPTLKNLYEYLEVKQQVLSDLLKKYKTILESNSDE